MNKLRSTLALICLSFTVNAAEPQAKLLLADGERKLAIYNADFVPSPDRDAPWYGRSGFVHPVFTPAGRVVTSGFPSDHLHQHGLMFAWTSARVDGRKVDFWNSKKQEGHVEHVETVSASPDRIAVRLRHVDDSVKPALTVLRETWEITRVPHAGMNVFDLVSTQHCEAGREFKLKQYHYGAMCLRGADAWMDGKATFVTSEGRDRIAGNHSRPHWVMMHGKVDGAPCGIAAMSHPGNFRAPQPVRLHPKMPYFCFAPMVAGDFAIKPGEPYVSRFRFVAFDGAPDRDALESLWRTFSDASE